MRWVLAGRTVLLAPGSSEHVADMGTDHQQGYSVSTVRVLPAWHGGNCRDLTVAVAAVPSNSCRFTAESRIRGLWLVYVSPAAAFWIAPVGCKLGGCVVTGPEFLRLDLLSIENSHFNLEAVMPSLVKGIDDEIIWGALALGTPVLLMTCRVIPRVLLRELPTGIANSYALLADNSAALARRMVPSWGPARPMPSVPGHGANQADTTRSPGRNASTSDASSGRAGGSSAPLPPREEDKCAVCWEPYNSPCCTSCGHWFCGACILRVWQYRAAAICMPVICPICRRAVTQLTLAPVRERAQRRRRRQDATTMASPTHASSHAGPHASSPVDGPQEGEGEWVDGAVTDDGENWSPPASPRHVAGASGSANGGVAVILWRLLGWVTGQRAASQGQGQHGGRGSPLADSIAEYNRIFENAQVGRGGRGSFTPRQLLAAVPRMMRLLLTTRHLAQLLVHSSHFLMVLSALLYVVSPLDLISEGLTGIIGIIDDLLLVLVLFIYLRALYQTSVGALRGRPPVVNYYQD
eukprot:jgi/Mesvir1/23561/Mv18257-RA.1